MKEIIMVINFIVEGDGIVLYIFNFLVDEVVVIMRLVCGIILGSIFEFINKEILIDVINGC